jgi:ATP-dependent helicase HrpA
MSSISPADFEPRIADALAGDRFRLRKQLRTIDERRRSGLPFDRSLARFSEDLEASITRRRLRRAGVPSIRYDDTLPIVARREEIAHAIAEHQVVVVSGETGSGKSTQLPKICLELGRGIEGLIGHTQPRRIAARSVASRIAQELNCKLGHEVGYKIRFTDATDERTYVKLMTDGVLLAESHADPQLRRYDTIIIDEAHERSLNIDFLLGLLQRLLPSRPDLKIIITSATIDAQCFAEYFRRIVGEVPVIEVSGRAWPVETLYRPLSEATEGDDPDWLQGVVAAVDELTRRGPGDMLVFLPTEQDIHTTVKSLGGRNLNSAVEIVPLYARLAGFEQQRVFQSHTGRRIVLATNVAESSLTVPGIRYVIDTGTARISRYSARMKVERLPIEPISQASADQRAGRCGRVGPGVCVRLYSEEDYASRDRYTVPEIQRSNLAAVILQALALRFGRIEDFPFLDPPRPESIRDGYRTLFEIGAIDERHQLTELGRTLSRIPVDPRIARVIVAGADFGCLNEILIIAAALEIQDPRDRPMDRQQQADDAHARWQDEESDFLAYLKLWDAYHDWKQNSTRGQLRALCREHYLSYNRMREWLEVHRQLLTITSRAGYTVAPRRLDAGAIHRAMLAGFLSGVAQRRDAVEYVVAGGQRANLWPGSAAFERPPRWLVACEMLETNRRYLRTAAPIRSSWIEPLAGHLVDRSYRGEHWDPTATAAMTFERVQLWGMTLVRDRRVPLAKIDPHHARQLFIEHGLLRGDLPTRGKFLDHNRELLADVRRLQHKTRRQDFLRGFEARYDFYDARLPEDVIDGATFERWRLGIERGQPRLLFMSRADLVVDFANDPQLPLKVEAYPDALFVGSHRLELEYRFDPSSPQDGVTVTVPKAAFHQLDARRLDWLVPGYVEEKVLALIKSLPKPVRRQLVPAPEIAHQVASAMPFGDGVFASAVARELSRVAGQAIPSDAFRPHLLGDHLRMRVRVVADDGRTLATGRDLAALSRRLFDEAAIETKEVPEPAHDPATREGITTWDFGPLADEVEVRRSGLTLVGYPTLVDRQDFVALELANSPEAAQRALRGGARRLYMLATEPQVRPHVDWLPRLAEMLAWGASLKPATLREQLVELVVDRAFLGDDALPRDAETFASRLTDAAERIAVAVQDVAQLVTPLLSTYHTLRQKLRASAEKPWPDAIADVQTQVDHLTSPGFLTSIAWTWLEQFPRYFRAAQHRLERIEAGGIDRDRHAMALVTPRWRAFQDREREHRAQGVVDPQLERYGWMLEEYRVSLFAQKLGTQMPVSEKRLDEQWRNVTTS